MITIKDKQFRRYISQAEIDEKIKALALTIDADLQGKDPLFLVVLTGAFMFAADLLKAVTIPCEVAFTRLSSYAGTESTGQVTELMGIKEQINGRHVVIVEDIVDSGHTLNSFLPVLQKQSPASVAVASLIVKPAALKYPITVDYHCFSISNEFIVGYGLDYDGYGRNLKDIYQVV